MWLIKKSAILELNHAVVFHICQCYLVPSIQTATEAVQLTGGPRVVICAHSGIEVAQENDLFIVGDAADGGCEVFVELVFCIRCCGHCRGIHAGVV